MKAAALANNEENVIIFNSQAKPHKVAIEKVEAIFPHA
jgi:hypothetical protein